MKKNKNKKEIKIKKIKRSDDKIKNVTLGVIAVLVGLSMVAIGILFLFQKKESEEDMEITLSTQMQQCKSFAAKRNFFSETDNATKEVIFYKKETDQDSVYNDIIGMQGVIQNCQTMSLKTACIGWSCEVPQEKIKTEGSMPFFFTLKQKY